MNRIVLIASLMVVVHASGARAQSAVYAGGDLFLDMQRGSGTTTPTNSTLDAKVGGGGVRLGAFLSSRWTLEVDVDRSAAADTDLSFGSEDALGRSGLSGSLVPIGPSLIVVAIDERVRSQVTATSVLLGYHAPPHGRLTAGFKGGISFLRNSSTETSTTRYTVTDPRLLPIVTVPAPMSSTSSAVFFNTAAVVGAELAISLTSHAAVVPELRAFGVDGRMFIRPGAELRWLF